MSARIVVSLTALLSAGCATIPAVMPGTPSLPAPTCKSAADCDVKWSATRAFVLSHTSYQIQNDSVDRLETFDPTEVSVALRASVTKLIQPDGSYAIEAKFWCNNLFECKPDARKTLEEFNRTIAAAGSAMTAPAPVATPVATPVTTTVAATVAATADSQVDAEKYIKDSEAAWAHSVAGNDTSVVRRILADDCVWVFDGKVMDKAEAIADAAAGPGDFVSNQLEYAHVRFFGETAVVQGSELWTRKGGKMGHFVWIDTWVRRNGQWQIVAAVDTVALVNK